MQQEIGHVTAIDLDPVFVEDAKARLNPHWPIDLAVHDMIKEAVARHFDAVYCLDVLEHIDSNSEDMFMRSILAPFEMNGVAIVGIPSLESQRHASPQSKVGHVNCKSGADLKAFL